MKFGMRMTYRFRMKNAVQEGAYGVYFEAGCAIPRNGINRFRRSPVSVCMEKEKLLNVDANISSVHINIVVEE